MGFIDDAQLASLAHGMGRSDYSDYLAAILNEPRTLPRASS